MKRLREYLFIWDALALFVGLWVALMLRHLAWVTWAEYQVYLLPFAILFAIYLVIFYIAGIYNHRQYFSWEEIFSKIVYLHALCLLVGMALFYLSPYFAVQPKTILIISIGLSLAYFVLTRLWLLPLLFRRKQKVLILAEGVVVEEFLASSRNNFYFNFDFQVADMTRVEELGAVIKREGIEMLVLDYKHQFVKENLAVLYKLFLNEVVFVDIVKLYEDYFEREPVTLLSSDWCLRHVSNSERKVQDSLIRLMDIFGCLILAVPGLICLPFIVLVIKLDDGGGVFFRQERVGRGGRRIEIWKIRTMTYADEKMGDKANKVTRVGGFLRKSRLDELPQIWNVFKGDLALIGPRPERVQAAEVYAREIHYYNIRHLLRPGLSGWAQLNQKNHPHHDLDITATEEKLSFDLYYVRYRSLWFNIKIAVKTIAVLLSQEGK